MIFTTNTSLVTHPALVIEVEGIKCRALIDTGAGSSYASSKPISKINKKPIRKESKRIKTLMQSVVKKAEIYQFEIGDTKQAFKISIEKNKLEKDVLLELPNPNYPDIQKSYNHLKDIIINDTDTKNDLPVHVILGTGDYRKLRLKGGVELGNQENALPN